MALRRYLFVINPFYLDGLGYDSSVFRIILCCLILLICTPNIYDFLLIQLILKIFILCCQIELTLSLVT